MGEGNVTNNVTCCLLPIDRLGDKRVRIAIKLKQINFNIINKTAKTKGPRVLPDISEGQAILFNKGIY